MIFLFLTQKTHVKRSKAHAEAWYNIVNNLKRFPRGERCFSLDIKRLL